MSLLREIAIAICLAATAAIAAGPCAAGPLPTSIAALNSTGATDVVRARRVGWDWTGRRAHWPFPAISDDLAARLAEGGYYPFARFPYYYPWYYYSYPRFSSYGYVHPHYGGYYRYWGHPY